MFEKTWNLLDPMNSILEIVLSFERCPIPYYIFYVRGIDCRSWEQIHEKVGLQTR